MWAGYFIGLLIKVLNKCACVCVCVHINGNIYHPFIGELGMLLSNAFS